MGLAGIFVPDLVSNFAVKAVLIICSEGIMMMSRLKSMVFIQNCLLPDS